MDYGKNIKPLLPHKAKAVLFCLKLNMIDVSGHSTYTIFKETRVQVYT